MKKFFLASVIVLSTLGLSSCGDKGASTEAETAEDGTVISSDTTVSEVEVERTVIETDTTTSSETIEVENQ